MSKILFGQSYFLRFDAKLWQAMQPYPPLGTLYAAALLRETGYDVALFDAMLAESEQEWAQALQQNRPNYAVLYEDNFNYLSKMCLLRMREAAFTMIEMAGSHNCTVIVCGADCSDHTAAYLDAGADYVLLGEGEQSLVELLAWLENQHDGPLADIRGVAYQEASVVRRNPRRPDIKQLDQLPFPAWDLVDVERYRRIWQQRHGYFSMNMVTTRGCPYHCNWCAKPIWGQRYNVRSPQNVAAELAWLKERYAPDHIWFVDDIMGLKPNWWRGFADDVNQRQIRTPFKCLSRVDLLLRGDAIEQLQRAGCDSIWVGAESGSQKILNAMEKGTTVEQIAEATARLQAVGVNVGFFLQFGYPGETVEDIELTLQMVRDCAPDDIGMSVSYPLPGTPFYDRVQQQLGPKQNWTDSADLAMLYQGPFTTEFYRQLHVVLHKEFRATQAQRRLRSRLQRPQTATRADARLLAGWLYRRLTLPLSRHRLNTLARQSRQSGHALPVALTLQEAAQPTLQSD